MAKGKTLKESLLGGASVDELVAAGHHRGSVIRALHELESGIGVKEMGRRPNVEAVVIPGRHKPSPTGGTEAQYQRLAITIVHTAYLDLVKCYASEKRRNKKARCGSELQSSGTLEKWFRQESQIFTDIDPETIIRAAWQKANAPKRKKAEKPKRKAKWMPRDPYVTLKDYRRKEQKANG